MGINNIKESNEAVVGIVTAVLLLGLFISVIALIQTVYVPNWMEQKEAEHMEIVRDQFSQLKFAIDIHSAIEQEYTPIATTITMGSKELPFFMSQRAYGALEIISDEFNVNITNITGSYRTYNLGTIKYSSDNAYFIDQSFIYESGAVITSQSEGNSISVKPVFIPENISGEIVIHLTLINITGVGNKTAYGGYDSIAIQTEYYNCTKNEDIDIPNIEYINITTTYANSWSNFINSSLKKELNYYENEDGDFEIIPINDGFSIKFIKPIKVEVDLIFKNIYAQIGPGWVE